jgi:CRISPR-associated endonuclease Cas1
MNNIYLRPSTTIALAEDPRWLVLLHPEVSYSTAMHELVQMRSLLAFGHVGFEPEVLPRLLQSGISVVFFGGDGDFLGRLEPNFGIAPELLAAQINLSEERKLYLTQQLVRASLRQHRRLIQRCQRERQIDLAEAIQCLDFSIKAIKKKNEIASVSSLLGSGLHGYYQGLSRAIQIPGWAYESRKVATPFTAMFCFGYRLLEQEIRIAIAAAGLDPRFGLWHTGADALAKDFATGCKPLVDAVVLRCINRGQVSLKDFDGWKPTLKSLPFLVRGAIQSYFEKRLSAEIEGVPFRDAIGHQAQQMARFVLGEVEAFDGLEWK